MDVSGEELVRRLTVFLRSEGHVILNDGTALLLTADLLDYLARWFPPFDNSQEPFTPGKFLSGGPHAENLAFLFEFVQMVPVVQLVDGRIPDAIVDLSWFRNISSLEINKIAVKRIAGLSRMHGHLESLSCHYLLRTLESILFRAGRDNLTAGQTWSALTHLDFSYNALEIIDESLRLVPAVKRLDLSHNAIIEVNKNFSFLTDLDTINLGFNSLRSMQRANEYFGNVKTLNLQSNQLSALDGLDRLYSLEQLDLRDNIVENMTDVRLLGKLPVLVRLLLSGNPVAFQKEYRIQTFIPFGTRAREIYLDNARPSVEDMTVIVREYLTRPAVLRTDLLSSEPSLMRSITILDTDTSSVEKTRASSVISDERTSLKSVSPTAIGPPDSPNLRRRRSKIIQVVETADGASAAARRPRRPKSKMTSPLKQSASLATSTSINEDESFTARIEALRKEAGDQWLLVYNQQLDPNEIPEAIGKDEIVLPAVEAVPEPTSNTAASAPVQLAGSESSNTNDDDAVTASVSSSPVKHFESEQTDSTMTLADVTLDVQDTAVDAPAASEPAPTDPYAESSSSWRPLGGPVSTEFFVESLDVNSLKGTSMIISVNTSNIVENDILTGRALDILESAALMRIRDVDPKTLPGAALAVTRNAISARPILQLEFGYSRKMRKERLYMLEDAQGRTELLEILQPIVAQNEKKNLLGSLRPKQKCLQCGHIYEVEAETKPGTSPNCPKCGGSFVVAVYSDRRLSTAEISAYGSSITDSTASQSSTVGLESTSLPKGFSNLSSSLQAAFIPPPNLTSGQSASSVEGAKTFKPASIRHKSISGEGGLSRLFKSSSVPKDTNLSEDSQHPAPHSTSTREGGLGLLLRATESQYSTTRHGLPDPVHPVSFASTSSDHTNGSGSTPSSSLPVGYEPPLNSPADSNPRSLVQQQRGVAELLAEKLSAIEDTISSDRGSEAGDSMLTREEDPIDENTIEEPAALVDEVKYTEIDHKWKLHYILHYFKEDNERFVFQWFGSFVLADSKDAAERDCVVMFSNLNAYIFLQKSHKNLPVEKVLKLHSSCPLRDLLYVDVGLGKQSIRFEFQSAFYMLPIRDSASCQTLMVLLGKCLSEVEDSRLVRMNTRANDLTLQQIEQHLLRSETEVNVQCCFLCFVFDGRQASGKAPVTLLCISNKLFLCEEDYHWPPAHEPKNDKPLAGQQFQVLKSNPLANLTTFLTEKDDAKTFNLVFETGEVTEVWRLQMMSRNCVLQARLLISTLWRGLFQVELAMKK